MAETSAADIQNQVSVEEAGPAKKKLTITIPAAVVTERIDDSLATLINQTPLPGFRKGKAPKKLIERRFGTAVRDEARNQLLADAYAKAIDEHHVRVVGDPQPSEGYEDVAIEDGKDLVFAVEVEVIPEIDLPDFESLEIKKPVIEISDEHIDGELTRQLLKHGATVELEGPVQRGDRVYGNVTLATKGNEAEPEVALNDAVAIIPRDESEDKGHILGMLVDDLADTFVGKKVGDDVAIKTKGPESYERVDLRGKDLTIGFEITGGERIEPATVEQMMETYGLDDEADLRAQVRIALEERAEQEQAAAMREQVADFLLESTDFGLPERLSEQQADRINERSRIEMLYRGLTPEEADARVAELRSESEAQAQKRLRLTFLFAAVAEHFDVQINEQEVNGRIAMLAAQNNVRPEQLRAQLARDNRMQNIAMQIREHKAADRIIDQAKVTEISAEEWNKQVAESGDKSD